MLDRKQGLISSLKNLESAVNNRKPIYIMVGNTKIEIGGHSLKYHESSNMAVKILKERIAAIDYDCLKYGVSPSVEAK